MLLETTYNHTHSLHLLIIVNKKTPQKTHIKSSRQWSFVHNIFVVIVASSRKRDAPSMSYYCSTPKPNPLSHPYSRQKLYGTSVFPPPKPGFAFVLCPWRWFHHDLHCTTFKFTFNNAPRVTNNCWLNKYQSDKGTCWPSFCQLVFTPHMWFSMTHWRCDGTLESHHQVHANMMPLWTNLTGLKILHTSHW